MALCFPEITRLIEAGMLSGRAGLGGLLPRHSVLVHLLPTQVPRPRRRLPGAPRRVAELVVNGLGKRARRGRARRGLRRRDAARRGGDLRAGRVLEVDNCSDDEVRLKLARANGSALVTTMPTKF